IDDIQLSAESHDALPHANQSKPVALRNDATVGCSASIVLDRQRQPTSFRCGRIPGLWAEFQIDASLSRMRMFVDVGKAFLNNSIDVRRCRRRQLAKVTISVKRDFYSAARQPFMIPRQNCKASGEPEVIDLRRTEGP